MESFMNDVKLAFICIPFLFPHRFCSVHIPMLGTRGRILRGCTEKFHHTYEKM